MLTKDCKYQNIISSRRNSVKKMLLEILKNSQENTCARVSFLIKLKAEVQVFSCEFCEISKNTFSYRTPPVAASNKYRMRLRLLQSVFLNYFRFSSI